MSEAATRLPAAPDDPKVRARRAASGALLAIAVVQLGFALMLAVIPWLLDATMEPGRLALALGWTAGLGTVFAVLGVWARVRPLPATAVGLGLYVGVAVLSIAWAPERLSVALLFHLVLAALLVRALRICLKAR